MQIPNDYRRVFEELANREASDHPLAWRESSREAEYLSRLGGYTVIVSINRFTEIFNQGLNIKSPVAFQLLLPEGLELGRFEVQPEEAEYSRARTIYDRAHQSAKKKADMLKEVEAELRRIA
jgi:hypothetical protein